MNSKLQTILLVLLSFMFASCGFPPSGWSSKEAIERLANEKAPVGSSKQVAEAFFRDAGVKWTEFPNANLPRTEKSLVGWAEIKRSWPVMTSIGVSFKLGADDKIESIKVIESHTGP